MELFKKENILILVALACLAIWYYGKQLNNEQSQNIVNSLPIIGGLAFGLNTLIQLAK